MHTLLFAVQVPLQLGTAFTSAAQHSWTSPPMRAALGLLLMLMRTVPGAGPGSLASSIRQQLQQSGMLQQLAAVMTAMAADLQAEAATLAPGSGDTASFDIEQLVAGTPNPSVTKAINLQCYFMELWGCQTVPFGFDFASSATWLWGPSGQIAAAMQLQAAMLQHVSAVVQHIQKCAPQQEGALLGRLAANFQGLKTPSCMLALTAALFCAVEGIRERGTPTNAADSLQALLLTPHTLPFLAMVLVIHAVGIRRVSVSSHKTEDSSSDSAPSGSSGCSSAASTGHHHRRQQQLTPTTGDDSGSSSGAASASHTACEAQLLQLLGLAPEVVPMMDESQDLLVASHKLGMTDSVCIACFKAASCRPPEDPTSAGQLQHSQHPQRQHFEQQLQLLLPAVLLPSAHHMLTPTAQYLQQQLPVQNAEQRLLAMCSSTLEVSMLLCNIKGMPVAPAPAVWVQELLDVVLQLADMLLYQRPPAQPTAATAACSAQQQEVVTPAQQTALTAGPAGSSTSSSNSQLLRITLAACNDHMLSLLLAVACRTHDVSCSRSHAREEGPDRDCSAAAVSPLGARFVEFGTALEAVLRAISVTLQSGTIACTDTLPAVRALCIQLLLPIPAHTSPKLVQHMGLCGPVALAQEQLQLCSLLSTVLKMGSCKTAGGEARPCWGAGAAGCCLGAGKAAVALLKLGSSAGSAAATDQHSRPVALVAGAAPAPAAATVAAPTAAAAMTTAAFAATAATAAAVAAAAQQPEVDYLPSLVIFGRCCLQWAEQLSEQTPDLLLGFKALPRSRRAYVLHMHGAYCACIGFDQQQEPDGKPKGRMAGFIAAVSGWVGSLESRAVLTQLEAAGCAPQQLLQQLDALLTANRESQPGKPTEASLAALVQQLQATGRMLCNIAVPHFCNNLACTNISGPTEAQLVSGRGCVCAGCRTARYCGPACQRAAWKQHRPVCKALAAAVAAPAGVGS